MHRRLIALSLGFATLLGLLGATALAQGDRPPADATPGADGITGIPWAVSNRVPPPAIAWRSSS